MTHILENILQTMLYSTVIFGAVMLFRRTAGKRMHPSFSVLLWTVFALRLTMPVMIESPVHLFSIPVHSADEAAADTLSNEPAFAPVLDVRESAGANAEEDTAALDQTGWTAAALPPAAAESEPETASPSWSVEQIVLCGFLCGSILLSARRTVSVWRHRSVLQKQTSPASERTARMFEEQKRKLGIGAPLHVRVVDGLSSPALSMGFRPEVLVPVSMENHPQLALALRHELMHYRRADHLLGMLAAVLEIVWWFDPVVWFAFRQMRHDMETACDASCTAGLTVPEKADYAGLLIELGSVDAKPAAAVVSMSPAGRIEHRIRSVFRAEERTTRGRRAAACTLVLVLAITCFTTACQPTPDEEAIAAKHGTSLTDATAAPASETAADPEVWIEEKIGENDSVLRVDIAPAAHGGRNVPSGIVAPRSLSKGEAEKITEAICPGIRMVKDTRTRQVIAEEIAQLRRMLTQEKASPGTIRAESIPLTSANAPTTPEGWEELGAMPVADRIEFAIEGFEMDLVEAPDETELETTDYAFSEMDDGTSEVLSIVTTGREVPEHLTFENNMSLGASVTYEAGTPGVIDEYEYWALPPALVPEGAAYSDALSEASKIVRDFGAKDMILQNVSCGTVPDDELAQFSFRFVPEEQGYPEISPDVVFWGATQDGQEARALRPPETIDVIVREGRVVRADWMSLSRTEISNTNTAVISWAQAREIAARQLDRIMTDGGENSTALYSGQDIMLNSAVLGLVRVLQPDEDTYALIPAWTFLGYSSDMRSTLGMTGDTVIGMPQAFVTVNAIDGSIVDRAQMY